MTALPGYPTTRYEAPKILDFSDEKVRGEYTPDGFRIFLNKMDEWKVKDADARELLRSIGNGLFYELKKNAEGKVLDSERLQRISYAVGIYKALHILYDKETADSFVHLPNSNRLFGGRTPLEYMKKGGLLAMQSVRRLLDARRGGI
jgi:hypothetical protein